MKNINNLIDQVPGSTLEDQFELINQSWNLQKKHGVNLII